MTTADAFADVAAKIEAGIEAARKAGLIPPGTPLHWVHEHIDVRCWAFGFDAPEPGDWYYEIWRAVWRAMKDDSRREA